MAWFLIFPGLALAAELVIRVEDLRSHRGSLAVAVHDQSDGFPDDDKPLLTRSFPLGGGAEEFHLELPDGTYALAVFHDENDDHELARGLFGLPREDFGFSQNPRIYFGAPGFSRCKFEARGRTELKVQLKHF